MNDRSKKSAKKRDLRTKAKSDKGKLQEIEYYLNHNGDDTKIIKNIALSSLVPKAETGKQSTLATHYKLMGVPFFIGLEDEMEQRIESSPFWSFTMMVKDNGDHKLLFSSQEDAEDLYNEILKD